MQQYFVVELYTKMQAIIKSSFLGKYIHWICVYMQYFVWLIWGFDVVADVFFFLLWQCLFLVRWNGVFCGSSSVQRAHAKINHSSRVTICNLQIFIELIRWQFNCCSVSLSSAFSRLNVFLKRFIFAHRMPISWHIRRNDHYHMWYSISAGAYVNIVNGRCRWSHSVPSQFT